MKKIPDTMIETEFLIHDLKIPIAVIDAGATSLLNRQDLYGPLTEKQVKVLTRILRNTAITRQLVNDALDAGRSRQAVDCKKECRVASLVMEVLFEIFDLLYVDVCDQVNDTLTVKQIGQTLHPTGTQLCFSPDVWGAIVYVEQRKIQQILRNLISNAFKYRKSQVIIGGDMKEGFLIFSVEDDGPGIAKEDQHRVFESYVGGDESLNDAVSGHGLGLAGVRLLLEHMGGAIDLESDKGKGTRFVVSLPLNG